MEKVTGEDGESRWMRETTVDHFVVVLCINDEEPHAEALVAEFVHRLPLIWSDFYSTMQSGFADYGHSAEFPPLEFFLSISRMTPDLYMGDKSSFHVRFEFEIEDFSDKLPFYDFYLSDSFGIVHHQPVF